MKIGIFDSGVGALSVYREIRKAFPKVDIDYFGDTLRMPYGSKTPEEIQDKRVRCSHRSCWFHGHAECGKGTSSGVVAPSVSAFGEEPTYLLTKMSVSPLRWAPVQMNIMSRKVL